MERLVRNSGFDYSCQDDPDELILIMCSNNWEAFECHLARQVLRTTWKKKLYGNSKSDRNSLSFLLLPFILLFYAAV